MVGTDNLFSNHNSKNLTF